MRPIRCTKSTRKSGIVLSANSAAIELHRVLPYESELPLIGARLDELTPPEMQQVVFKHLNQVVRDGSAEVLDLAIRGRYFDVNSALISAGQQRFIQMILHDVTQRHEMLDTLLKSERLAAAGTFASGVAHEVNNPLASISSLVQSMVPDEKDEERRAVLHTILVADHADFAHAEGSDGLSRVRRRASAARSI